jgi:hypothetical protein
MVPVLSSAPFDLPTLRFRSQRGPATLSSFHPDAPESKQSLHRPVRLGSWYTAGERLQGGRFLVSNWIE